MITLKWGRWAFWPLLVLQVIQSVPRRQAFLFTLASAFPHTILLDTTLNHQPETNCIALSQTSIRLSYSREITAPLKEQQQKKNYNVWSALWITWLRALEDGFESQIRVPWFQALACPAHTPEPVTALHMELPWHELLLERLQMPAVPLDEGTQVTSGLETSPGQQLWINTEGVLERRRGSCWRQAVTQTSC